MAITHAALIAHLSVLLALDPNIKSYNYVQDNWQRQQSGGIPDNMVNCVIQDRKGYLWLATTYGLARFDGIHFNIYNKYNCDALTGNLIMTVYEDKEETLWIGSIGGLARFKNGKIESLFKSSNTHDFVWTIYEDSQNTLWIGTEGAGLRCLKNGKWNEYSVKEGLSSDFIRAICEDDEGAIWIGTRRGLNRFKDGTFTVYNKKQGLPHNFVRTICKDNNGKLWIGTYGGGLCRWENNKFIIYNKKNGLPNEYIRTIYEDRSGNLWIGTRLGLTRFHNGIFTLCLTDERSSYLINSICEDNEKNLWVGTESNGLIRLKEGIFRSYTHKDGLTDSVAWCIYEDKDHTLWIGMRDGLFYYKEGNFNHFTIANDPFDYAINSISRDNDGNLWVGTESKGLKRLKNGTVFTYGENEGIESSIRCIYSDPEGNVWIGTYDAGLVCLKNGIFKTYNTKDGLSSNSIKALYKDHTGRLWIGTDGDLNCLWNGIFTAYNRQNGFPGHNITVIHKDKDDEGTLWIGTSENGLIRFQNNKFTSYTTHEGLSNDAIYQILEDRMGNLWLGCQRGVFYVSKKNLNDFVLGKQKFIYAKSYDESDGMATAECSGSDTQPSGEVTADGKLWFITTKGVAVVDPKQIKINKKPPQVRIEQIIANSKNIELSELKPEQYKEIVFPPGVKDFTFNYTAFCYYAPEKIKFKIKLEGFDNQWENMESRRTKYYTNIPPGKYRFLITACNNDGIWNPTGTSLVFELKPYFYQTRLFFLLVGLVLVIIAFGIFRLRIKQLMDHKLELEKVVHERTHQLEASNRQLEASNRSKSEFLARMSHEIRTPMSGIIGFTDMLLETPLNEEQLDFTRTISRCSEILTGLLNDILDFSRIEAGELYIHLIEFDPRQVTSDVLEIIRPKTGAKSVELKLCIGENVPTLVKGDKLRFRQVLLNLVGNAAKFTEKGEIELILDVEKETERKIKFHIKVRDTGIGIPEDNIEEIFTMFHQIDGSDTRKHGGVGLGLTICRQLSRIMGGEVWCESILGKGSTFHFTVWLEKIIQKTKNKTTPSQEQVGANNSENSLVSPGSPVLRILLAEDNPVNQKLACFIFIRAGYHVTLAHNGKEAVEKFTAAPDTFDMIFMDVQMPQMNGFEATRLIRQKPRGNIPIIAMTAQSMQGDREKCLDAGMDDYIAKPIKKDELLTIIKKWKPK